MTLGPEHHNTDLSFGAQSETGLLHLISLDLPDFL